MVFEYGHLSLQSAYVGNLSLQRAYMYVGENLHADWQYSVCGAYAILHNASLDMTYYSHAKACCAKL